jgi:hypothetical protein
MKRCKCHWVTDRLSVYVLREIPMMLSSDSDERLMDANEVSLWMGLGVD